MKSKVTNMSLAMLVLVTEQWHNQSSCANMLITMAPCLSDVTGSSSTLTSSCCSQIASVMQRQPRSLCTALNGGGASLGITINQTLSLALALPAACNVKTLPVSECGGAASPAGSPEGLPGPSTVSLTGVSSSTIMNVPLHFLLLVLLFISYAF